MKIHNVKQGTEEWLKLRLGKLTASDAQAIATNGKGLETLAFTKVAEIITGKIKEDIYTNADIERGHELEAMARNSYELETENVVKEVGFMELDEFTGCSPDGAILEEGLVEIKCPNDLNFVRYLYDRKIDPGHNWQMQFQLFVSGREWVDYVVFNENFPKQAIITRVVRNETEIAKLKAGVDMGIAQIKAILERVKV
jgi:hypothetical protein